MATLSDIVNDVVVELHGNTADLEQAAFLTSDIAANTTSVPVDDATQISRGLIEIDDELLWVTRTDPTNNLVAVPGAGRGMRGSVATTHGNGTMVINNPRFPRSTIVARINETVNEMYPEVFVVKSDESNAVNPVQITYALPADCDNIISISVLQIGPSEYWTPIRKYDLNPLADINIWPTGKTISVKGPGLFPGQPIRVTYAARPGQFVTETDTLQSIGLDDNFRDVLRYGACYRLVGGLEGARLQNASVEQGYDRTTYVGTSGASTALAKYYLGMFQSRMENERARLLQVYPSTSHMTR